MPRVQGATLWQTKTCVGQTLEALGKFPSLAPVEYIHSDLDITK